MNKTAIKNFAIWARNKLIADVSYDARLIGITEDALQSRCRRASAALSSSISALQNRIRFPARPCGSVTS